MDVVILTLAASATALATGLGAVPVWFMGVRAEAIRPILLGTAIGAMTVASIVGLLRPALQEGSVASVFSGSSPASACSSARERCSAGATCASASCGDRA